MDILLEAASPGAFHNSGERFDPPKCYPNTRVAVLSRVMDWIIEKFGWKEYIMWLYGPAGAGKSAIAQTIAEMCHENHSLLASFFFSRSDPKRSSVGPLAASLAYQVAVNLPQARSLIEGVIANDPAIFQRSFKAQFNALILEPLMQVYKTSTFPVPPPHLMIIDGLDECNGTDSQRHILETISDALSYYKDCIDLKILFASRTEPEISLAFSTRAFEGVTAHVALDDAYQPKSDIRQYFDGNFSQIKKTHLLKRSIPAAWPSDVDISSLVTKSSGQFIYAATVIRYITSSRYNPTKNLEIILGLHPTRTDMPFAELDALYSDILSRVEDINATLRLLGAIILSKATDQSTEFMEELILLDEGDATRLLADLSSIIMVNKQSNIRVLHASLGDFLLDQARSKEFHINPTAIFSELSHIALDRIARLSWLHISEYTPKDHRIAWWWFAEAQDFLFHANPTDELREKVLETPFIPFIYSMEGPHELLDRWCGEFVDMFLMGLKTSGFANTKELYLYHRGVWDKIMHERLGKIESDTLVNTIVAAVFTKLGVCYDMGDILTTMFELQICIPLTLDDPNCGYKELLQEFVSDPIRAGKYISSSTKFATLAKIFLEFLILNKKNQKDYGMDGFIQSLYTCGILDAVEELIPHAGPSPELIEMLNNSAIILPNACNNTRLNFETRNLRVTVRTIANYLGRVCGSVPPGFRITVKGNDGEGEISYYYDADDE